MQGDSGTAIRYEWELEAIDGAQAARVSGYESKEGLSMVFTMWLKDCGDISDWEAAPMFGKIVHSYSTLTMSVIAVWLGIDHQEILEQDSPGTSPWEFTGPDGNHLELSRTITRPESGD
jgi:hypothetical protein